MQVAIHNSQCTISDGGGGPGPCGSRRRVRPERGWALRTRRPPHGRRTSMTEALVARRKLTETWRDSVARRGALSGQRTACLRAYDVYVADGRKDFEAAYLALRDHQCLWRVDGPEDPFSVK